MEKNKSSRMGFEPSGPPRHGLREGNIPKRLTLASKITVARILIVPLFIITILYYTPENDALRFAVLGIFLCAMGLDVLDGYIARKFHQESKVGALLDPLADKILLTSAYICLYKVGNLFPEIRFPIWLVVAVVSRDVALLLGATVIHLIKGDIIVKPTIWGKMAVFFQTLAVIGILLQWAFSPVIWCVILLLVVVSGLDYIIKGIKELNSEGI